MNPGDAVNAFLAQVELRGDMPFLITTRPEKVLETPAQGRIWEDALGEY